jgi:hypothetical protein
VRGFMKVAGIVALLAVAAPVGAAAAAAAASSNSASILQAGVIAPQDVPGTWQQAAQPDAGVGQLRKISVCKQYAAFVTTARKSPFRLSPRFSDPSNGGSTMAEDTVYAFKSASAATKYVTALLARNVPSCIHDALQQQIGNQGQVGALTPITGLSGVGDQSTGYESVVTVPGQGTLIVDEVGVRVGRAFVGFTFANPTATIPEGPAIVNAVVNRLSQVGA